MDKERIEWTGDTSTIAFAFRFIGDIEPEDAEFDVYRQYEKKHPGALVLLKDHYDQNEEAWKSNRVELTEQQIEQLQIYIDCVNSWYIQDAKLFMAMNALHYTNMEIDNWDPADQLGRAEFCTYVDWWRDESNWNILLSDIFDRMADELGEDSYLYEKLVDLSQDELIEYFHDFWAGQFDLEVFLENNEDEISEEEDARINKFLESNAWLTDFRYSSMRFHKYA
jgi:hypothetical protein